MKRNTSRNEKLKQMRTLRKQRATLKQSLASIDARLRKLQKNSTTASSARAVPRPPAKLPRKRTSPGKKRQSKWADLKANRLEIQLPSIEIQAGLELQRTNTSASPRLRPGRATPWRAASDGDLPLKARIDDALRAAGPGGVSLQELAAQLGVNYKRVVAWFATTGRKIPSIQKVGLNAYRYVLP